ncbi:hypothetical protein HK405_003822 [Cladochytrium tenue]|nr:hypothetical protein HK405_003822 [Cladochytrium tenue]
MTSATSADDSIDGPIGLDSPAWRAVSHIIGWAYFLAWSASFYPQVFLNRRRRSVKGLSFDFLYLNLWGFLCYTAYNATFYGSETVRKQYRDRFGSDNLVQLNDVGFGVHATVLTLVTIYQTFIYQRSPGQKVATWAKLYIAGTLAVALLLLLATLSGAVLLLDVLYFLSYVKIGVSLLKYIPQAILNFRRRSTTGWSIGNILLDFTGGILSFAQQFLDASLAADWSGIWGNPVKLGLSILSIFFDVLFMVQHYVLYKQDVEPDGSSSLLDDA